MTDRELIERLRTAAQEAWNFDTRYENPPLAVWSELMEEAANALQDVIDDEPYNEPRTPSHSEGSPFGTLGTGG